MNKRTLGNTGISVSEIAFGGVEIGMPYGIGVKSRADMPTKRQAVNLLHAALDSGINFFDTARSYGQSEEIMGQAFKDRRDSVVISSKCKKLRNAHGLLPPAKRLRKNIEKSIEESLAALRTDYIDVYMLHETGPGILDNEDITETFRHLKQKGVIRATGVSTYSVEETGRCIESGYWDVIQLPFNLMDQSHKSTFPMAGKHGTGIVVRSVLFKGILSEKGRNLHEKLRDVEGHVGAIRAAARDFGYDMVTLALKFALSFGQVSSVLVGIDRPGYLKKSIAAADGNYLNEEMLRQAKSLEYHDVDFLDLIKWDRMGWLK